MKTNIKNILKIAFSQIVVYVIFIFIADGAVGVAQRRDFSDIKESYTNLIQSKDIDNKQASKMFKIDIQKYNIDKSNNSSLDDLRERGVINLDGEISDVNSDRNRTFYAAISRGSDSYDVIHKKYSRFWYLNRSFFINFSILYFLIGLVIAFFFMNRRIKKRYEIHLIANNLHKIRNNEETTTMIIDDDDPLSELVDETHKLDKSVTKLRNDKQLNQRRFKSLIENLPVGVMLLDNQGRVLLSNQSMSTILGKNISKKEHSFLDDIQTYSLSRMIEHSLRNNRNYHKTFQLTGNSEKYVDASTIVIANSDEELDQQVLVILYDLTDIHRVEQMQTDFVKNASSELRHPIHEINRSINKIADEIGSENPDKDKIENESKRVQDKSDQLVSLSDDILELQHFDDKTDEENSEVDLKEMVAGILDRYSKRIDAKHIEVSTEYTGDMTVSIIEDKIYQIVSHLISNAISYNKENGHIDVNMVRDNGDLTIKVSDTGVGIADDDVDRIFERFYRVDKNKSKNDGGTGLGLSIVYESVKSLNGDISVDSQLGVGSTFTVKIEL